MNNTIVDIPAKPFKAQFPVNPSWAIASQLPEYLPPLRAKGAGGGRQGGKLRPVRILVHPEPIHVGYQTVRELVPKLWDLEGQTEQPRIDMAVHIGMAGPNFYEIERVAHREGYAMKDVDGEFLKDQDRQVKEGRDWIWYGVPKELRTDFDLDDVLERWKRHSPVSQALPLSTLFMPMLMLNPCLGWPGPKDIG